MIEWSDGEAIQEMRFDHAWAMTADKKETKETSRPVPRQAPADAKCGVAFQTNTCDQLRDHAPFSHACGYCFKTCAALYHHSEKDCIRKVADAAKNGWKREQ